MKRIILAVLGVLTVSAGAEAQNNAQMIERALLAAPARGRDATSVIRWNANFTYETIKEGTSQLVEDRGLTRFRSCTSSQILKYRASYFRTPRCSSVKKLGGATTTIRQ